MDIRDVVGGKAAAKHGSQGNTARTLGSR
jgi:hypothetical protein